MTISAIASPPLSRGMKEVCKMTKFAIATPPLSRGMKKVCKSTKSAKEISVAEKEQSEALTTERRNRKDGDFSARANFFWYKFPILQNSVVLY